MHKSEYTQQTFTSSKSTIETLEQGVQSVQNGDIKKHRRPRA